MNESGSGNIAFLDAYRRATSDRLKGGGGGDTLDPMDARVTKLEGQFDKLNDKVDELRIDVAVLKEKVSNLPSKGFIVTATVGGLALFSAIVLFQERIASLLGG